LEAVFVQLPCPLGRGFWNDKLSFYQDFSPLFFKNYFQLYCFLKIAIQPCQPLKGWQG